MKSQSFGLHLWWKFLALGTLFVNLSNGLNTDGVLLLSFKYSILSDPLGVLDKWSFNDQTPCSWEGVRCGANSSVITISLPNSQLLGSIPSNLGMFENLQTLDLSNNSINGSIPFSLYNVTSLEKLDLSNNLISGELSELVGGLKNLQVFNLSDNALAGNIPKNLTTLRNLAVVCLKSNYFSGSLPSGFDSVQILDLSSNLINGSLPSSFGSSNIRYFNLSYNRISGQIPVEFGQRFPENVTMDLSVNNLTGPIPESSIFYSQESKSFTGNYQLCGKPLKNNPCPIPSIMSAVPNVTEATSPPAIAAIPKTIPSSGNVASKNGFKVSTILGIVMGDVLGIAILAVIAVYVYKVKQRRTEKRVRDEAKDFEWDSSSETKKGVKSWVCFKKQKYDESEESSTLDEKKDSVKYQEAVVDQKRSSKNLVTVDGGDKELELEALLKASAYILGATGSSIMYKAVLEDGTMLAVRRIGESGLERFRDFENQVRVIAKLVHPNLVQIRGFYWGADEKLIIYDFVPNGSLANARYRKAGSSPCSLPWEVRLKIAKGMARGLAYIHERKHVHGNLKPSNILLGADMEPKIGDFGLERLVVGDNSYKSSASARNFGSKRSTGSRDSFQDTAAGGATPSPSPSALGCSPYYAPESLRSLKPNQKWDVYSFGVVLLELLTGKVIVSDELGPTVVIGNATLGDEEKNKVLRMADVAIRGDLEGKEESLLALLRLGYSCISPVPQKRPAMKEALHGLEKFPLSTSSSAYLYGHY
ncbi:putative LRR receptor-like serine/threonine-protein kinase [Heracleum sosnowskyi]|uniref:non-specific serine/threonine protein kinase n=1 Tax=Heracleum sosnowskyi TaxID=360622 RepID=A0AAD8H593_9APIA|nr:putative LRR receptor-like serine/threonine-protein kinase [Heracleum sosnowskyi]